MSKAEKVKLKDLPVRGRIWNKHKNVTTALCVITFIMFSPFVLLQVINDILDSLINKTLVLREELVYTIFKVIYKKEIIANEEKIERSDKHE